MPIHDAAHSVQQPQMTPHSGLSARRALVVLVVALGLIGFGPDRANAITATSCMQPAVQAAVDQATDGETVTVPAGACTWNDPVQLSNAKGVTLMCATLHSCVITANGTGILFDTLSGLNDRLYRISGFDFRNSASAFVIWIAGNGTASRVRVDNNTFTLNSESVAVFFGATTTIGNYYGVIDHNRLTGNAHSILLQIIGATNPSPPPSQLGTANNMFVEDNTVTFASVSSSEQTACADAWGNAAIVWRRNATVNCLVASHGVPHSGGPQNFELYNNDLRVDAGSVGSGFESGYRLFHHQGSGTFVGFNNTFTPFMGQNGSAMEYTHYRSATPADAGYSTSLGRCDGTSPIDGNREPRSTYHGYPCWRQPGRDFRGNLIPMYAWNNRWSTSGARVPLTIADPFMAANHPPSVLDHIKPERDFYNSVSTAAQSSPSSPFTGATGMGFGTLTNRPATCTTGAETGGGVGYFATDQGPNGILYRCSATNTWVPHYAPYAYPHPLVSGIPAPPPIAPGPGTSARCAGRAATIVGTAGRDRLVGTPRRDVIVAYGGNDTILGKGGNDLICAGAGNDTVDAGSGADRVLGGTGNDTLRGGTGKDRLEGLAGRDSLSGGPARDLCIGGAGRDRFGACETRRP